MGVSWVDVDCCWWEMWARSAWNVEEMRIMQSWSENVLFLFGTINSFLCAIYDRRNNTGFGNRRNSTTITIHQRLDLNRPVIGSNFDRSLHNHQTIRKPSEAVGAGDGLRPISGSFHNNSSSDYSTINNNLRDRERFNG